MVFEKNGRLITKNDKVPQGYPGTWTNGLVIYNHDFKTASKYTIKEIDGSAYMFYEWKSGDYSIRHQKPAYYVLKKVMEIAAPTESLQNQQMRIMGAGAIVAESESFVIKDVNLEPVHQGKNIVHITVENKTAQKRFFSVNVYSRSVDFGPQGVGWGTSFREELEPDEVRKLRYAYKIQGPVTDNTYVRLRFYEAVSTVHAENRDLKPFAENLFEGSALPKFISRSPVEKVNLTKAFNKIIDTFKQIQRDIKRRKYEEVWNNFTKDYQQSEYQVRGFEAFKKHMEPKHPLNAGFHWDKDTFVKLKLNTKNLDVDNDRKALVVKSKDESWRIYWKHDFKEDKWVIDDITGYIPGVIEMQEKDIKKQKDAK
ncbi:MAG: hypothetical protein U9Q21_01115 [Candidatus Auribacterota bacterium]|nr:hypothetical protein [Candidatus Auribacterota bacterium]